MKYLLKNATLLPEYGLDGEAFVVIDGDRITYVGKNLPTERFDRIIDCSGKLLMPAFYNTHCHAAMTLFRGYGDDLPLNRWLDEKILPAEDKLTGESVYWASLAAIAEMLASGCVSFSDMYMFENETARAVIESGAKANLSRGFVSFDENIDVAHDSRFIESQKLYDEFNNEGNGRVKIDFSLHAEYTNVRKACSYVADYCKNNGIRLQIHLSETRREREKCIAKYGITPARFFDEAGAFDVPVTAAHCVWISDDDIELLAQKQVCVSHNPSSNLKLGSGIMPYSRLVGSGIRVSLGTDGAASNNSQNIMKEMQLAALLHKGACENAEIASAAEMIKCATRNGALAQGRDDCGRIEPGYRADLVLIDLNAINNIPYFDAASAVVYSADRSNVTLTMCDGRIIYENGEYKSIDIEQIKYNMKRLVSNMLS